MQTPDLSITVYHLEMCDRRALRPRVGPAGFEVSRIDPPMVELNRQMYRSVGGPWDWTDRLQWPDERWQRYVHRVELATWVGRMHDQQVGYFELETQDGGDVEIKYFGLLPEFIGRGLGGALLTAAIERAWQMPLTQRLWVHTCTNDHEHALENYRRRGFEVFKTERV